MRPSNVVGLRCRACGAAEDVAPVHVCSECLGPLEVAYDDALVAEEATRDAIAAGPASLWRYETLLPRLDGAPRADLSGGWTPLVKADRLARELGLRELWLKDDTRNPTGSFKDRVVAIAMSAARAFEMDTVACASTGNLAHSLAAHAARAGLRAFVFIPNDLEPAKVVASAVYGANVVAVKGTYDEVNRLCSELADERPWGFVNVNLRPFYAEGSKTLGFEIAEQLSWELPDHVVVPIASGSQLTKVDAAFRQLGRLGLVEERAVRVSGAQPAGCSPVSSAFARGEQRVTPVRPDTIARSLAIGDPADGDAALVTVRETGGGIADVSDEEIVDAMSLLARTEGIFAETAGGVTIGVLRKLVELGVVGRDERVVALVTGTGLKTMDAMEERLVTPVEVGPSVADFEAAFGAV